MTRRVRRSLLSMVAALAVMVVGAALAWACTPQAIIYLGPSSIGPVGPDRGPSSNGPAGSTITVKGEGFIPGPVEIRMGSGPPLATATGPEFSVRVKISAAKPGVHYVEAVAYKPDGSVAGQASRALRVKAPAAQRQAPILEKQPVPRQERTKATPKQPAVDEQPAAPVKNPAPAPADAKPAAADPVTAADPVAGAPVAERAAKRAQRAIRPAQAKPAPRTASREGPPVGNPWSAPAPARPGLAAAPASDDAGAMLVVALVFVGLGLVGLGGVGHALLVRVRARPPAPEAANRDPLSMPESETRVVSIEDELQKLIAASSGRKGPETSNGEQASPPETLDSPS